MAENMMCKAHKATNENSRKNYDRIFKKKIKYRGTCFEMSRLNKMKGKAQ